ncbi:MAG: protein kinase [Pseudomonadota bacterium]
MSLRLINNGVKVGKQRVHLSMPLGENSDQPLLDQYEKASATSPSLIHTANNSIFSPGALGQTAMSADSEPLTLHEGGWERSSLQYAGIAAPLFAMSLGDWVGLIIGAGVLIGGGIKLYQHFATRRVRIFLKQSLKSHNRFLNFSLQNLGPDIAKAIAKNSKVSEVKILNLQGNQIGDKGAKTLAKSPYLSNLIELDLRDNEIGSKGMKALAKSSNMLRLEHLSLSRNNIGDKGVKALAASPNMAQLGWLYLDRNNIGDKGAKALAESPNVTQLKELSLGFNNITDGGVKALAESPQLTSLSMLFLTGNKIGDEGLRVLYQNGWKRDSEQLRLFYRTPPKKKSVKSKKKTPDKGLAENKASKPKETKPAKQSTTPSEVKPEYSPPAPVDASILNMKTPATSAEPALAPGWSDASMLNTKTPVTEHGRTDALAADQMIVGDKYTLIRTIGTGGYGVVYLAHDPVMDRDVAIKMIHKQLLSNPTIQERFKREFQVIAALQHQNIVQIYEADPNCRYYVMEYLQGENLGSRMHAQGGMSLAKSFIIFTQLCVAMERVHTQNLVHRDVKPSNIFLTDQNNVKLLDFGVARMLEDDSNITMTGQYMGTPLYMSPEQCRGERYSTAASDIYSMGVILYQMLTGEMPIDVRDRSGNKLMAHGIMINHIMKKPKPMTKHAELQDVIFKALEKEPNDRYQSVSEFLNALKQKIPR